MLFKDVVAAIEATANPAYAASWDKSGLQVASTRKDVSALAVCLDATPRVIGEALTKGADFILAHHPLSLEPRLPNRLDAWREALCLLLGADVPLYAAHTSLDVNPEGPAGWLGRNLRLANVEVLEPIDTSGGDVRGYGGVGDLPEPMDFKALTGQVLRLAGVASATLCGPEADAKIRRIAWCGGSGGSMAYRAKAVGAQLFVTGDIKYHTAMDAPLPVLDVGHHSLEEIMMQRFSARLQAGLPEIKIFFVPTSSPFRTIAGKKGMTDE